MMRYLKYIFLSLISCILTLSCIEELDMSYQADENLTTLVPRVKSFTNQYVTKAEGDKETEIKTLSALIFDNDGKFVDLRTGSTSVTINKSMLNSPANQGKLTSATIVMFANMSLDDIKDASGKSIRENLSTLTLAKVDGCSYHFAEAKTVITDLASFADGLPMTGRAEGVNLTPSRDQQGPVTVNLQILYAKINFSIGVENGSENTGSGMKFAMTGYSVHNASKATALVEPEGATVSSDYSYTSATGKAVSKTGTVALNGTPLTFTFYVAESRYEHNSNLEDIYPSNDWLTADPEQDVKNYDSATDEAKLNGVKYFYDDLIQQYKPKLANVEGGSPGQGLATYVLLKGTYTDYRGTAWTVNYKVYLGKDNALNFHVDRNSEYTNYITIKGIRNNDSHGNGDVWVDHRVNVTYNGSGADDHVTITRETLLDAHIEVRPLRVKWTGDEYDGVRVYLPTELDGSLVDWIGIERFTRKNNADGSTYCFADGKSTGKRKYFTTDLISDLQNKEGEFGVRVDEDTNKKYIYLLNEECAWIYFDENVGSTDRQADITLEFYTKSGSTQSVVYKVKQRGLQTVGGYAIESYEEYLHSYDSADKYNLSTSPVDYTQQGLAWGFPDHKLSQSTIVNATNVPTTTLKDQIIKNYSYDYFHQSDGASYQLFTKTSGSWASASFGTGLDFTDRASANRDIAVKDMGTVPENAYQYCLSKNKFEADDFGSVSMTINWYLPDPYEMQAILAAGLSGNSTADLDSDAYYWSSQPSFERLLDMTILTYELSLINETTDNARAVSAQGIADLSRKSQNRIRCVYARDGKYLDEDAMEDRVPDGIGGNYTIYMKAWNNSSYGYFNYMLPAATTSESSSEWVYNDERGTNYPNDGNAGNISGEKFKYIKTTDNLGQEVKGFDINPGEVSSWTEYDPVIGSPDGYYTTLLTYPGLTEYTVQKRTIGDAYKPTTTKKTRTQTATEKSEKKLDKKLPSASDLKALDHLTYGNMLNISFAQDKGSTLPAFVYDELVGGKSLTNTSYWVKPTYNLKEYPLDPQTYTKNASGKGSETGISTGTSRLQQASVDDAKKVAFDGTTTTSTVTCRVDGAYPKAKNDAKAKLDEILKDYPTSEGWTHTDYKYTSLSWNQATSNISWTDPIIETGKILGREYTKKVTITCTVTVTASVTVSKPSVGKVYVQAVGTGVWGDPKPSSTNLTPAINTDELRIYCGNSFTISLSEAAKAEGYEITNVKVHYSGDNHMGEYNTTLGFGGDNVYARFVDSEINLSEYELPNQSIIGSTEVLQLPGMDFSSDGETGWHQWAGEGRNSITLLLADYNINYNKSSFNYTYNYDSTPQEPGKYIIVDQIEVKCAKKKNVTFDFTKIYAETGVTSDWTIKHITFTAEGGTDENPSGVTAAGLKLYSGSKVTFKALDGYVINSISGDESLTFKGSQQTVEFTNLPEKTITEPIVVLYNKDNSDTN